MKFERTYTTGFGNDPRNKVFAVFNCEVCGKRDDVEVRPLTTFSKDDRRCPKCGALGHTDLKLRLQSELASLEQQEAGIQKRREEILAELSRINEVITSLVPTG